MNDRNRAIYIIERSRRKPPQWAQILTLAAMVVFVVLCNPLGGWAAPASQTPPPTSTPAPTDAPATPAPTVSFSPMDTPVPRDAFFETDSRNDIPDYDNPAYTYDSGDDPYPATSEYLDILLADNADTVDLVILLTLLALIPSLLIMVTGFTRIIIVLGITRNAMGTQNMPPNQVMTGLALFLTFFLMFPVFTEIQANALEPYLAEEINLVQAGDRAIAPIRDFMIRNTWKDDMELFCDIGEIDVDALPLDEHGIPEYPLHVLIPAFLIGELKIAFWSGFCIYIPFIVVDMIVASTLMSMGMMMLPPVMISLPFKLLLFVSVDGWKLVVTTLLRGFN